MVGAQLRVSAHIWSQEAEKVKGRGKVMSGEDLLLGSTF
jgi:hypothetical protein